MKMLLRGFFVPLSSIALPGCMESYDNPKLVISGIS
jgi:hypothetical protein